MPRAWAWLRVVFRVSDDPKGSDMSELFTAAFWLETLDRAIKSAAQGPLVAWGVGDGLFSLYQMDWGIALGAAAGMAIVSLLTSVASAGVTRKGTASVLSVPGSTPPEAGAVSIERVLLIVILVILAVILIGRI